MKLVFRKDKEHQISVFELVEGRERDFSYIEMIRALMQSGRLDEPDISEGFTEAEVNSIKSMVTRINKEIAAIQKPDSPSSS